MWAAATGKARLPTVASLTGGTTRRLVPLITASTALSQLVRVADLPGRRSLRSARTNRLLVPSVKLPTVDGQAFLVSGPTIWTSLPDNVISAPSLSTFRQRLETVLFHASFPDIIIDPR